MPFSSITIPLAQNFESFDLGVDVFNDNTFFRQCAIEQLAFPCQRTVFAPLVRNATVFVEAQSSLITTVGQQQNPKNDRPNRRLEQLKIMDGTLFLSRTENFLRLNVDDDLCFYRVPLFLSRIPTFLETVA